MKYKVHWLIDGQADVNSDDLERVQKSAFCIILGRSYKSYKRALTTLNMDSLLREEIYFAKNLL